ncbi:hypothetical protein BDR22DRAFT_847733 [Usnea florida]
MMAPDVHTPLESLLLFQTLHPFNADPPSFGKISDVLKKNDLLRESDSFELDRLEPDALKNLYLRLLKEEAKCELRGRDQVDQKNEQQNPRKRKLGSPLLETVEEALQYNHLLPQLVNRLYFKYRDYAIKSIEDEERKYRSLREEAQEMERGDLDGRTQDQDINSRRDSRGVSSIQTLLRHDDEVDMAQQGTTPRPTSSHEPRNGLIADAQTSSLEHPYEPPPHGLNGRPHPSLASTGGAQQMPNDYKNASPFLPPPQNFNLGNLSGSPNSDLNRRPPSQNQPPNGVAPSPSPRLNQTPYPGPERSSASPLIGGRVLPPPPAMLRSSGSPTGPLDALADISGPQYRANPPLPSSRPIQHPGPQQHPNQLPAPRGYMPPEYPYYPAQTPYHPPYPPYGQGPLPAYNHPHVGIHYQGHAANAVHGSPYGNTQQYQPPVGQYAQHPNYNQSPGYYAPVPIQTPHPRSHVSRFTDQHTPMSNASGSQRPPRPTPIVTSASSTKWKDIDTPGSVRPLRSPVAPSSREISPISDKEPSPSPESAQTRTRGAQSQKGQPVATNSPSERVRTKRTRGTRGRGRGGRAGSVASSTVADSTRARTRSQSVVSQADELAMDNQSNSTRKIKPEPSIASPHDDDASAASQTADEARRSVKQRRGTIGGPEDGTESGKPSEKRRREEPATLPPPSPVPDIISKPGHVLASRNFARISQTVMNDVIHHKVANVFAKPLTEREAPGYRELIYRPQDLNSIKKAISNGSKAANAVIEDLTQEGSSSIWIPESPDVIPPKGIVNSGQLEKELMRMFANAVMFNPDLPTKRGFGPAFRTRQRTAEPGTTFDEDREETEEVIKGKQDVSVVKDTREMFEAVEKSVSDWRSAEKAAENGGKGTSGKLRGGGDEAEVEDEDVDELAGEDVVGSVEVDEAEKRTKRRRR